MERQAAADKQAELDRQAAADRKAEADRVATEQAAAAANALIPVSSLNRTKYVAPRYPRAAERRNLSGWVEVVFTVTTEGNVRDVEVRDSDPGDVFVNAAIKAVEKWEFEPITENGVRVEKRAGVRMIFAL